ncbi:MAG TPA: bifunctional precorrin-2 dehydrogenase/sirohydrochlorin ferrochelatase [Cytophagaceae bacterium]|nr:bifunctional precorrin-2 dehydrogenase/sirohydrochlorin ferrochelatase [Cytophagaceae bacterium]
MQNSGNQLFPVFFRMDQLQLLIVGGGNVAMEKLSFLFKNSDNGNVKLVAVEIKEEIREIARKYPRLKLIQKAYEASDLEEMDLAIAATSIKELNEQIRKDAKQKKILINVADTPDSCDFYLGSVIKKGDLKIAISTNGKSPTFAKRMRELLEDAIPDNISEVLDNLRQIRDNMKGDLAEKMKKLNEITSVMKNKK